jgi:signal transduction histidine kinase
VTASNDSGVWNEAGAAVDVSIAPAYYQTWWFRLSSAIAFVMLMWGAYRHRVRQVAREFDVRLQERVHERTRIARELHDTLLQSFHGLLFFLQTANNLLPGRPLEAKQKFESAIDRAAQALIEGRDAVQNLRSTAVDTSDLAAAFTRLAAELSAAETDGAERPLVHVALEGSPRPLHPVLGDEIYRIAGEALRNALRHAGARHIEVEIRFGEKQLQVRIRDDGRGIAPGELDKRKPGHFGLPGVRERADLIGARLEVWSQVGIGTEVDLSVPANLAYSAPRSRRRLRELSG